MKRVYIIKSFAFEAAHHLPEHQGKCKNLHGHRWEGEVTLSCQEKDLIQGMVMDFADLKTILNVLIVDKYDHKDLNLFFETPTCEHIAGKIFDDISFHLDKGRYNHIILECVKLNETPGNSCMVMQ